MERIQICRGYREALRAVLERDKTTKPFFLAISLFQRKYKSVRAEKKGYFVSVTYMGYVLIPLFNTPLLDRYTPTFFSFSRRRSPSLSPLPVGFFISLRECCAHVSLSISSSVCRAEILVNSFSFPSRYTNCTAWLHVASWRRLN